MKKLTFLLILSFIVSCKGDKNNDLKYSSDETDTLISKDLIPDAILPAEVIELDLEQANKLAALPLECLSIEYPNKLGQTLESKDALGEPSELHPAFYGCYDWHSAVHAHWTLVSLLKQFPKLENASIIREKLQESLSVANINKEVDYFKRAESDSYERTYGWAWLLKLAEELKSWEDPMAQELYKNLEPLSNLIVERYSDFLPKLRYPIRVGEHTNTAFGLGFAYDYAIATENIKFQELIAKRASSFYLSDDNCPIAWEPSGYDFLSPCLEEVDIMRRVLPKAAFDLWLTDFMPQLKNKDFNLEVGEVSDRTDGKLVHLDGLNFSRAWVLYGLASDYPKMLGHLKAVADKHIAYSFPNVVGDNYEGGHWLGTFAVYALQEAHMNKLAK